MMLQQDEIEKFELLRDIAEHNAMFQNPDGVRQVREARETTITIPDDDFEEIVKGLFGRDISLSKKNNKENVQEDQLDIYKDFDEVEFVPFGG